MRICIVGSCGKNKKTTHPKAPTCDNLLKKEDLKHWQKELAAYCVPARDMYTGNQNRELVRGVNSLRMIDDVEVDLYIISAGFGLLAENEPVPPYDCTFSGLPKTKVLERAKSLEIDVDFQQLTSKPYDLYYLALGKDYFTALNIDNLQLIDAPVIQFVERNSGPDHVWLPSGNQTVKAFAESGHKVHGAAGFKGDLLRILAYYAKTRPDPYSEIMGWIDPSYISQLVADLSSHSKLGSQTILQ